MRGTQTSQRTNVTKTMAKTALVAAPRIEVGLACDAGTSNAGIYGLTDLFTYAGEFAAVVRAASCAHYALARGRQRC
jgi:hypothetical protein